LPGLASILLISASWIARITGVSHWRPAQHSFLGRAWWCPSVIPTTQEADSGQPPAKVWDPIWKTN
jgi:hypothetical protein